MTDSDEIDFDGAYRVGAKVIEMADRVKVAHAAVPGAAAAWGFEIDDVRFEVRVTVGAPLNPEMEIKGSDDGL